MNQTETDCVIAGGGPAGMVLGLLLARAGVRVTVLEKHGDFLRDFRGDTVHPATLQLLDELGLRERFDALPQTRIDRLRFQAADGRTHTFGDFSRLRRRFAYVAMVPQWDLLDLLADAAREEPTFTLRMNTEVTGLLREGGRVTGVRWRDPDGEGELRANLTVGCDGRWSVVRQRSGLKLRDFPLDLDVWWFRLPSPEAGGADGLRPFIRNGNVFAVIPREGYLQIAHFIPKGSDARLRALGVEAFSRKVADAIPIAADTVHALDTLDQVKLLDVRLNRLHRWHTAGLLCIGDAAHAMSPAGGVGINLAIQDAVAASDLLADPLLRGVVPDRRLAAVRRRRLLATVLTQAMQRFLHRRVFGPLLAGRAEAPPAGLLRLTDRFPAFSVLPARLIGVGVRPEHAPAYARRPAKNPTDLD